LPLLPATVSAASASAAHAGAAIATAWASEAQVTAVLLEPHRRMHFDASAALEAKLDRVRDLLRHRAPNGDLAVVVERAVDLLLGKLEKERLGKTSRTPRIQRPTKPGRIARATRREIFERDGEQCTFVAEGGARCPSRTLLEPITSSRGPSAVAMRPRTCASAAGRTTACTPSRSSAAST